MEKVRKYSSGKRYSNGEITVYWKPDACIHASHCYRELIEVFDPGRRPWVDIYGATTGQIIETVNMCPTEALTWKWNDEEKNMDIDPGQTNHINFMRPELMGQVDDVPDNDPVNVKVMPDGPLIIKGTFTMNYSTNSKEVKNGIVSLCRCGASNHMPFCDGMHRKIDFNDI
jgi:uncharacterized Fe-S cluster protein YjdI